MSLFNRTPPKYYFIFIFSFLSLIFILFSLVIYKQHAQATRLNELTMYNYEVIRQSRRILLDLLDMETGVRGYLLTAKKEFLEPYESSKATLSDQITKLWEFTKDDPTTQDSIDIWLRKIENFSKLLRMQVDKAGGGNDIKYSLSDLAKQKQEMDALRALLERYINVRLKDLQGKIDASKEKNLDFNIIIGVGALLFIGTMLLATLIILNLIRRNMLVRREKAETEERFMMVMNEVNDGLFDFNMVENTIYYSPQYRSMLGYTIEEHPDDVESSNRILHPDDLEQAWEILRQYREGEIATYINEFRLKHKDGHWIWILSRGVGIRNENGEMVRLIGTHTDISQQKKHQEELVRLSKEMETFTYITSHDLRSPLVNLKGFAGELQRTLEKTNPIITNILPKLPPDDADVLKQAFAEEIPESIRFILQSIEKMDTLTTAVLDLSRIGQREYKSLPVDTQSIVQRSLDALQYEIQQKNIAVTCGGLPIIMSDILALEQVFSNVIDNAIKYLDPVREGKIDISATEKDGYVLYSIQDNGRGIHPNDYEKVFQIFRRARNTLSVRGTGLGMTFVQATLRHLGGSIYFTSTIGQGTTFYIRLPIDNQ